MQKVKLNTSGGYCEGSSFQTVKELCPESKILKGLAIRSGLERDGKYLVIKGEKAKRAETEVKKWLHQIKVLK